MEDNNTLSSRSAIRIPHAAIVRAPGLLPMYYSTSELSDELGVPRKKIVLWVKHGMPHLRDKQNHIWVNGQKCFTWIEKNRKSRLKKINLAADEAFCFRCNKPVSIREPYIQTVNGRFLISGTCPKCGCKINKGVRVG